MFDVGIMQSATQSQTLSGMASTVKTTCTIGSHCHLPARWI